MLVWINNVFSSNTDIARFITVLITSLFAIILLIINQWINKSRELRLVKIQKLELIGKEINDFVTLALLYLEDAHALHINSKRSKFAYEQDFIQLNAKMKNSISSVTILSQLYFRYNVGIKLGVVLLS